MRKAAASRWLMILFCLTLALPNESVAQSRRGNVELRAGLAVGTAFTSVGGKTSTDVGALVTGQVGIALSRRSDLTADISVQPFQAQNPVADEHFSAIYATVGVQVGLGGNYRTYLRPELGIVSRSWSGSEVFVSSERSLVLGLALGHEFSVGTTLGLAPELFVRLSGAEELCATLPGIGLSVVPIGARVSNR